VPLASKLGSAALRDMVSVAFVHALDTMLMVSGAVAVVGAVLAVMFLPRGTAEAETPPA